MEKSFFRDIEDIDLRDSLDGWYRDFKGSRIYSIRYEQLAESVVFIGVGISPISNGKTDERYVDCLKDAIKRSGFEFRQGRLDSKIGGYFYIQKKN
jgi:hypothetical protein